MTIELNNSASLSGTSGNFGNRNVINYGAVPDGGITDNTPAFDTARAFVGVDNPIYIPPSELGFDQDTFPPLWDADKPDATGPSWSVGTIANPTTDVRPMFRHQKLSDCDRVDPFDFDVVMSIEHEKIGGDCPALTFTVNTILTGSVTGGHQALSGRIRSTGNPNVEMWAGWLYADMAGAVPIRTIGLEVDIRNNSGTLPTWQWNTDVGGVDGLVVGPVDSSDPGIGHHGIRISKGTAEGWLTALQFGPDSCQPSDANLDGEHIFASGGTSTGLRAGGVRLGYSLASHFHYGIRTNEATFAGDTALWLSPDQNLRWSNGIDPTTGPSLTLDSSSGFFEFTGSGLNVNAGVVSKLYMNGVQVVSQRKTGWGVNSGTETRTGFNTTTVTLEQLAERVIALLTDLKAHGMIGA